LNFVFGPPSDQNQQKGNDYQRDTDYRYLPFFIHHPYLVSES